MPLKFLGKVIAKQKGELNTPVFKYMIWNKFPLFTYLHYISYFLLYFHYTVPSEHPRFSKKKIICLTSLFYAFSLSTKNHICLLYDTYFLWKNYSLYRVCLFRVLTGKTRRFITFVTPASHHYNTRIYFMFPKFSNWNNEIDI